MLPSSHQPPADWASRPGRHIVSLSGGKDSTALAIYLRDYVPQVEYVFCDTHKELPETYEYLDRLEAFLQRPIIRLDDHRGFDHYLELHAGMLPSPNIRWCTHQLKIKPFETYVGNDQVWSYIGIRGDEDRSGYISTKANVIPVYPFKEHGITIREVHHILTESGLGFPTYYEWRQRSGCFFCFFMRRAEWVGLKERHPDLFEKAKTYEVTRGGENFFWSQRESLAELEQPERIEQIKREHDKRLEEERRRRPNRPLIEIQAAALDAEEDELGCNICHL